MEEKKKRQEVDMEEWKDEKAHREEIEKQIQEEAGKQPIPESLEPENMRKSLERASFAKKGSGSFMKKWGYMLAAAACMGILVTAGLSMGKFAHRENQVLDSADGMEQAGEEKTEEEIVETGKEEAVDSKTMYWKIYDAMEENWEFEKEFFYDTGEDGATPAETIETDTAGVEEKEEASFDVSEDKFSGEDFGGTNLQVEFVDEGDIVKNDGRYLYQLLSGDNYGYSNGTIQIVDTKDGLKEAGRIEGFENLSEFYVWEDMVIVVESLWAEGRDLEKTMEIAMDDVAYMGTPFTKIHMYDISDREKPKEIHVFTLKGAYKTSRIADGYFYSFSGYGAKKPESRDDFEAYIPMVEGKLLKGDSLVLPEGSKEANYLVITAVDLSNPSTFTDTLAVVTRGDYYYVSGENIYILDGQRQEEKEGIQCDQTRILKFAYEKGKISQKGQGLVDGNLLDQFAMDEYKGYFRLITTVNPYEMEKVVDDITGEELGYYQYNYLPESNSVYVLDQDLNVAGSIEGLAEEERVYSARFMGEIGYFVTFRQVDPLFSVDFSNPEKPKVLGELKISGFSEYLHFYGENLLLGIGQEADEDTGRTEGLKLSMFDISNPADVKEMNKLVLEEYDYSPALSNHHAVLVSVSKNLIGFLAEGYGGEDEYKREYVTYAYNGKKGFEGQLKLPCAPGEENNYACYEARGTYIGNTFYLLLQDGGIQAYDLSSKEKIGQLEIEKK